MSVYYNIKLGGIRMKRPSKLIGLYVAAMLVTSVALAGCGSPKPKDSTTKDITTKDSTTKEFDTSKSVELSMYLLGDPAKDYDAMLAEFNKKAKADLNATLKVSWIGWGDFATKYPLVLSSGEPIDLIYTATWVNYFQQAQKGAFMPLEEIGPKYAPKSFATEPKDALKQATVDGHIYALPPNYTNYATWGTITRGDLMKKYGLSQIKTVDDYGKYLEAVVKNDKNMDPAGMYFGNTPMDTISFYQQNLYPLSGDQSTNIPFWIDITDPTGKVVNVVDKPDMPDFLNKMKEWSALGYWPKSVLSNKDTNMLEVGKSASVIRGLDTWVGNVMKTPEQDLQFSSMIPNSYPLPYMQDGMAIPSTSKNPERALMLLEKLRNDESYYNLLTYGIKDKDYEITSDNKLKPLNLDGFAPEGSCSWGFKDEKFYKNLVGSPANLQEVKDQIKSTSTKNIYTSFTINTDPIKNEYAAIQNVMQQYYTPLKLGFVDPVKGLATLKQNLKAAGVEKVQVELQKQIDEFRKNNK